MRPDDSTRRTGRTTRTVVQALCAMFRGQQVIYLCANQTDLKNAVALARAWLHDNGWMDEATLSRARLHIGPTTITFGTGRLLFQTLSANRAGLRELIVWDHRAEEVEAERLEQLAWQNDKRQLVSLMSKHGITQVTKLAGGVTNIKFESGVIPSV